MTTDCKQKKVEATLDHLCELGKQVVDIEAKTISSLRDQIDTTYALACKCLLQCKGRVVLIGMGKSGHIARKIAATLASTGTASYFIHPAEASHGDLGMLAKDDVIIAISNSGETQEILTLLPTIKLLDIPIITMTGNRHSTLSQHATHNINIKIQKEACPLGLAPTSSTTAALVIGDAIAITLLEARGFKAKDFARYHPAGALGRKLLLHVSELMHKGRHLPRISETASLSDALLEMTQKNLGMTTIIDQNNELCGIFTDGDLRRSFEQNVNIHNTPITQVMTKTCITITQDVLAAEALQIMEQHKITSLVVIAKKQPVGVVHMHDLLRAGIC